jgi:hypothetical protein
MTPCAGASTSAAGTEPARAPQFGDFGTSRRVPWSARQTIRPGIGTRRYRVLEPNTRRTPLGLSPSAVVRQEGSVPEDLIVALSESTLKGIKRPFPERLGSAVRFHPGRHRRCSVGCRLHLVFGALVDWEGPGRCQERSRLPADPTQRRAKPDRPRTRARNWLGSQQRSNDANVRAPGPMSADGVSIRDRARFSADR